MNQNVQTKIGQALAILGAAMLLGTGAGIFSGLMAIRSLPPGVAGTALLAEVVGLGLTEKNRDC